MSARLSIILTALTAVPHIASATPTKRQDCTFSVLASATDTCATLATLWEITVDQFIQYNPSVGANCANGVVAGQSYCVEMKGTSGSTSSVIVPPTSTPTPTTTSGSDSSSGSATPTSSLAPNGSPIPSPVQDGITTDCVSFYKVASGDTCVKIVKKFGTFSLSDFYKWNPAIGTDCSDLELDVYVCVGIPSTPTKPLTTTTAQPTGSPAPSPTQDGLTDKCTRFYKVVSGDSCAKIVQKFGTFSLSDFYSWNPAVGTDCSDLELDTYVCVGVPGTPTARPPPPPTPTGPSPVQDGIDPSCTKFYKVKSGDNCAKIVKDNNGAFSLDDFYKWNPAVGTDCKNLYLDYYVCIGVGKKRRSFMARRL